MCYNGIVEIHASRSEMGGFAVGVIGMTDHDVHVFYTSRPWRKCRAAVLELDKYECQICRDRGRYSRATHVHHVNELKHRPDLALSITDETGKRNLVSLCGSCHENAHNSLRQRVKKPVTPERW